MLDKIISGGQTGVDRAGLDVALALGLPAGGWCPQGRLAEDGAIPDRYPLTETLESDYEVRTRRNVEDSDGTLILNRGALDGGTALTVDCAHQIGKPCLIVALEEGIDPARFRAWLDEHHIRILNVAGPRESKRPGVYAEAVRCLQMLLRAAPLGERSTEHKRSDPSPQRGEVRRGETEWRQRLALPPAPSRWEGE